MDNEAFQMEDETFRWKMKWTRWWRISW